MSDGMIPSFDDDLDMLSLLAPLVWCAVLGIPCDAVGVYFLSTIEPDRVQQEVDKCMRGEGPCAPLKGEYEKFARKHKKKESGKSMTERMVGAPALVDLTRLQKEELLKESRIWIDMAFSNSIYPDPEFFSKAKLPPLEVLLSNLTALQEGGK